MNLRSQLQRGLVLALFLLSAVQSTAQTRGRRVVDPTLGAAVGQPASRGKGVEADSDKATTVPAPDFVEPATLDLENTIAVMEAYWARDGVHIPIVFELSPHATRPTYSVPSGSLLLSDFIGELNAQDSAYVWTYIGGVLFVEPTSSPLLGRMIDLAPQTDVPLTDVLTEMSQAIRPGANFMDTAKIAGSRNPFAARPAPPLVTLGEYKQTSVRRIIIDVQSRLQSKANLTLFQWGRDERMAPSWRVRLIP